MTMRTKIEIEDRGEVKNRDLPEVPALSRGVRGAAPAPSRFGLALWSPLFLFVTFFLLIKYLETTWFGVVQFRLFGWDFFAHLMMVVMPAVALWGARRPLSELGLSRAQIRDPHNLRLGAAAVAGIGAFWLAFGLLPALAAGHRPLLLLPPRFFAEGLGLAGNYLGWLLTVIFSMLFCGVGEEVMFRGYLQGRLNRALGRPFCFRGVNFGPALFLAAAIFGLGHGINYYNPLTDGAALSVDWSDTAATAAQGLLFGYLYEATGGIAVPAALHAAIGLFFGAVVFG